MRIPKEDPAPRERAAKPQQIEFEVELITRLFGGGAAPREVDKISWLRSSAAKSAIRAWWRAGNAHKFDSLEALRKREDELFGAQAQFDAKHQIRGGQGILSVVVDAKTIATKEYKEPQENALNGAYFPAAVGHPKASLGDPGQKTSVTLTFHSRNGQAVRPDDVEEIKEGLRLWLTLGGVGGRTRRSAGALAMNEARAKELGVPTTVTELKSFLRQYCKRLPVGEKLDRLFALGRTRSIWIGPEIGDKEVAHKKLLERMRDARQDREHPTGWRGKEGWGQSNWPEADAIRFKASRTRDGSEWSHRPKKENAKRYPRAALGLPIVMHYHPKDTEPKDFKIYAALEGPQGWQRVERYTSPILLRVVRVWHNGGALYVPVAIFTDCTLPLDTRPLVTKSESGPVERKDIVEEFPIVANANETLERVEKRFAEAHFEKI